MSTESAGYPGSAGIVETRIRVSFASAIVTSKSHPYKETRIRVSTIYGIYTYFFSYLIKRATLVGDNDSLIAS